MIHGNKTKLIIPTKALKWSLNIKCPRPWNTGPYLLSSPKMSVLVILISIRRKWVLRKNRQVTAFVWDHDLTTGNWKPNMFCDLSSIVIRPNFMKLRLTSSLCFILIQPIQLRLRSTKAWPAVPQESAVAKLIQQWLPNNWGSIYRLSILSVVVGKSLSNSPNRWQKSPA